MRKSLAALIPIALVMVGVMACATAKTETNIPSSPPPTVTRTGDAQHSVQPSTVDIEYVLGRDHYRLLARSSEHGFVISSFLDRKLIKKEQIDEERYVSFLKKATEFAHNSKHENSSDPSCRSPFHLTVQNSKEPLIAQGCRSSDDGALSKLVRAGEFLLYSRK